MRPWPFLLTLLFSHAASAGDAPPKETAALVWLRDESASSCPSADDATRAIEQRLGHGVLVPKERAQLSIEAKLLAVPAGGFRIELVLVRGDAVVGRRELASEEPSCQGVAETAALVIALAIDPEASLEPLPILAVSTLAPSGAGSSSVTAPPAPPPAREPAASLGAVPARHAQWQGDLELGGSIATGSVPDVALGAYVRGRALPPALPLGIQLEAAYFPAKRLEARPGKGANFSAFHLGAELCSRPNRRSRLGASLCGGAEVGALTGQGYGFEITPRFRTWTFALAARGALWFRVIQPLAVVLGPSIAVPLKRDYFETKTADDTSSLFRMSNFGLGFDLGLVWEL